MALKKAELAPRDPLTLLRQMTSELDRLFEMSPWPTFRWAIRQARPADGSATWFPEIDVFEKDNRLVTKIDLPGMKKEDVKVEVTDGHLTISGERKPEAEEKKGTFHRSEREYGSFYRAVPLPDGVTLDDVKASFADGVLEVSIPLPPKPSAEVRRIDIQEAAATPSKTAA
ncbi:MAG: Hsp20/alpha crystallin family protein [Vicinamibacterales bacterium]